MRGSPVCDPTLVLTDGYGLYVRARRNVYRQVDRWGNRTGATCSDFEPRPRWKPAVRCSYDAKAGGDGLMCPRCGRYDSHYARTGERSYCANQSVSDEPKETTT